MSVVLNTGYSHVLQQHVGWMLNPRHVVQQAGTCLDRDAQHGSCDSSFVGMSSFQVGDAEWPRLLAYRAHHPLAFRSAQKDVLHIVISNEMQNWQWQWPMKDSSKVWQQLQLLSKVAQPETVIRG